MMVLPHFVWRGGDQGKTETKRDTYNTGRLVPQSPLKHPQISEISEISEVSATFPAQLQMLQILDMDVFPPTCCIIFNSVLPDPNFRQCIPVWVLSTTSVAKDNLTRERTRTSTKDHMLIPEYYCMGSRCINLSARIGQSNVRPSLIRFMYQISCSLRASTCLNPMPPTCTQASHEKEPSSSSLSALNQSPLTSVAAKIVNISVGRSQTRNVTNHRT